METAFLGLGSNLGDREGNLRKAIMEISRSAGKVVASSPVYETEPWGFRSEQDFLNMAVRLETDLGASELLMRLLEIEKQLGRKRTGEQYSSRVIDIDILLYGDLIINENGLKIPHPRLHQRKFVLVPLCDIAPDAIHPVYKKSLSELLRSCNDQNEVRKAGVLK